MNNCLKEKSRATINSTDYLNYATVYATDEKTQNLGGFRVVYKNSSMVKIVGNGYFTNAGGDNLGKEKSGTSFSVIYSKGDFLILLPLQDVRVIDYVQTNISDYYTNFEGFAIDRVLKWNKSTIETFVVADEKMLYSVRDYLDGLEKTNLKIAIAYTSLSDYNKIIEKCIVPYLSAGKTIQLKSCGVNNYDFYGVIPRYASRTITIVSATCYEVYNEANTEKQYTANYNGSKWVYTLST